MSGQPQQGPADPFEAIAAEAASIEGAPPQPGGAAAAVATDYTEQAQQIVGLVASVALPLLPERYAARYSDRELSRIANALAKLCEVRGWDADAMLGRWAPELALLAALAGPVLPVLMAEAKRSRLKPAPAEASQQSEPSQREAAG